MCDDNNIEKMDDGTDDVISETEENMDETVVDADAEPAETEAESDEVEDDGCFSEYAQEMFLETYLSIPTRDRNILDLLEDRYDFRLLEKEGVPEAYNFEVESEFHIFADTSSGDVYGFIGGVGSFENDVFPIGFVSADHRVERIASNLWEFFSIIIACPFWERLLPVEPEERAEKAGAVE